MIVAIEKDGVIWLAYASTSDVLLSKKDTRLTDNVPLFALSKADGTIAGFAAINITTDITRYRFLDELETVSREAIEQLIVPLNKAFEEYGIKTNDGWNNALIVAKNGADGFECITPDGEVETWHEYYCFGSGLEKKMALGRLSQSEDMPPRERIIDVFRVLGKWKRENYFPVAVMDSESRTLSFLEEGGE